MLSAKAQLNLQNAREYFREHLCAGDYYSAGQKITGEWFGQGAEKFGLKGAVKESDFLRLCEGQNPTTGERLTQRKNSSRQDVDGRNVANRRVFYDFTISPPKSVSIVALYQDERILELHNKAVRAAMTELEKFASTRVRKSGQNADRTTGNIVGATFRHDTSRELDPHLWNANSHTTPTGDFSWEARVVEHVDELPGWKSKQEFLAHWVMSAYDPKRPVFVSEARAYGSPIPIFPIGDESPAPMLALKPAAKRFRVALSFPGEKRTFIAQVANVLAEGLGRERVLFDDYLTAELARPNLDVYLGRLYHDDSELLVPFYCAEFENKKWCGLEWRQMRNILFDQKDDRIMPFRFDDTPIAGVLPIDGYVSIKSRTPGEVAGLILERLAANRAKNG